MSFTIHRNVCTEYNLSDFWKSRTIYEIRTKVGKQNFWKSKVLAAKYLYVELMIINYGKCQPFLKVQFKFRMKQHYISADKCEFKSEIKCIYE